MAVHAVDPRADPVTFKVLVTGPFGVGKTTLIERLSVTPVVGTEVATAGGEAARKSTTTVGIEHGVFRLDDDGQPVELLLFGTPGQARFSAVREVAALGVDGVLLLVDATIEQSWPEAASLAAPLLAGGRPVVVAVNRWPAQAEPPAALVRALAMPVGTVWCCGDVVDRADAGRFLAALLERVLDGDAPDEPEPQR